MVIDSETALSNLKKMGRASRYPNKADARIREHVVFPQIAPRFVLNSGERIFTMGSCFARNIEWKLPSGFDLPAREFSVPSEEWPHGPNGILNEYNPGTMCQRIEHAANGQSFGDFAIASTNDLVVDLLLHDAARPTSRDRLMERRIEIDALYARIASCNAIIITLGMIEAWYDSDAKLFLNRMPTPKMVEASKNRYELHVMDATLSYVFLERTMNALISMGVQKIILTVSPVPFYASFSGDDAVVANSYSKAVLRVCAHRLAKSYVQVDYFPSFEMVTLGGPEAYIDDYIHVQDELVAKVTDYMIEKYVRLN